MRFAKAGFIAVFGIDSTLRIIWQARKNGDIMPVLYKLLAYF